MEIRWLSRFFIFLCGLFLVFALLVRLLFSSWDWASFYFLVAAGIFGILSLFFDHKSFLRLWRAKATRRGLSVGLTLSVVASALVLLNYTATYFPLKFDWTKEKNHTLSEFSKNVVASFKDKVELLYLQIPDDESKSVDESVRLAFEKYTDENPQFRMVKYNLMKHPEIVKKYKLNDQEQAMFVVYQGRSERFYKTDENSMTQALLRLLKGRKTLYFSTGHNELDLQNTNPRGISNLKKEIERLFYETQAIDLEKEVLPANAAALIILAPEKKMSDKFRKKVFDYYSQGGRLFVAFDPVQNPDESLFLSDYGLKMSSGVVHQEQNALANVGSFMVSGWAPEDSKHELVKNLGKESPVMFYVTGSLSEVLPHSDKITPILVSPQSTVLRKGFTMQDPEIGRGSYVLFSAVENARDGLMLVSADSDLFANQFLYQQMNPQFMFSVFSFLTRDQDVVKAPDLQNVANDFLVTDTNFKLYLGLFIIPLPLFFLVMSTFWWFRRRWL